MCRFRPPFVEVIRCRKKLPPNLAISCRFAIRYLRDAASDLLDPSADGVLLDFERSLQKIEWTEPGHTTEWQLFRERPLKTIVSNGEFGFKGKKGAHNCFATITSIWSITPVKPARRKRITAFQVCGKASVHVELFEEGGIGKENALGSWRVELGDQSSPGCFFHTQILAEKGRTDRPFPHSSDVPRLPCYFFTPMTVTEFVLGELFQDKWRSLRAQVSSSIKSWASIQHGRMLKVFLWHIRQSQTAPGSPWVHIKASIPEPDWFVRKDLDLKNPNSYLES